jgi:hypothetical protein
LNGDGIPDIAEVTPTSTVLLLGNPTTPGQFLTPITQSVTGDALALGDFNGDAKADLAITNAAASPGSVNVLLSSSISTATLTNVFVPGKVDVLQTLVAGYAGDSNYATVQSNSLMLNGSGTYPVQPVLQASGDSVRTGGTLSFGVTGAPQGSYTLYDGGTLINSVASATYPIFTETFLTPGVHLISADYGGTDLYSPGVSNTLMIDVWQFTAVPNPIRPAVGDTAGATTIEWNSVPAQTVEVHVGSPSGTLLASGGSSGSAKTGQSVTDGTTFYLQDTTGGKPLTSTNTLGTLVVRVWSPPSFPPVRTDHRF